MSVPDCGDCVLLASEDKLLSILLLPARLGRLASVPAGLVVNTYQYYQQVSRCQHRPYYLLVLRSPLKLTEEVSSS